MVVAMLTRPYPLRPRVVVPAVALMLLVPCYLVIAVATRGWTVHMPATALDRMVPLQPAWSVIYLSYLLCPFLPVLMLRQEEQIRRTFLAWLLVWITGYVAFWCIRPSRRGRPTGRLGAAFSPGSCAASTPPTLRAIAFLRSTSRPLSWRR